MVEYVDTYTYNSKLEICMSYNNFCLQFVVIQKNVGVQKNNAPIHGFEKMAAFRFYQRARNVSFRKDAEMKILGLGSLE